MTFLIDLTNALDIICLSGRARLKLEYSRVILVSAGSIDLSTPTEFIFHRWKNFLKDIFSLVPQSKGLVNDVCDRFLECVMAVP